MKKFLITGIVILFSLQFIVLCANKETCFEKVAHLKWGKGENELGTRFAIGVRYGPSDFYVRGNRIYILDRENKGILEYNTKTKKSSTIYKVPPYTDRFCIDDDTLAYYCADGFGIVIKDSSLSFRKPSNIREVTGVVIVNEYVYAKDERECYHRVFDLKNFKQVVSKERIEAIVQNGRFVNCTLKKIDNNTLEIEAKGMVVNFSYTSGSLGVSRLLYIGEQYIIILSEEIISSNPIEAQKMLLVIDYEGESIKKIKIPRIYYTYLPKPYGVYSGKLYYCISLQEGLEILSFDVLEIQKVDEDALNSMYPGIYHYNTEEEGNK